MTQSTMSGEILSVSSRDINTVCQSKIQILPSKATIFSPASLEIARPLEIDGEIQGITDPRSRQDLGPGPTKGRLVERLVSPFAIRCRSVLLEPARLGLLS